MNSFIKTYLDVFAPLGITAGAAERYTEQAFRTALRDLAVSRETIAYREEYPLRDADIADYCTKRIKVGQALEIITSLRFRAGDGDTPFIDVCYASRALDPDKDAGPIRDAVRSQYSTSAPESISFFVPGNRPYTGELPLRPAKALYAANLGQSLPALRHHNLSIRRAADMGFFGRYMDEYGRFNGESRRNRLVAQPESFDDLAELVAKGTLYDISIAGDWAGVIAYDDLPVLSVRGFEIVEEFLIGKYRGAGFGKYAQSMLIGQMQRHRVPGIEMMFGLIHTENAASIGTATRNGRICLGSWYELQLSDAG